MQRRSFNTLANRGAERLSAGCFPVATAPEQAAAGENASSEIKHRESFHPRKTETKSTSHRQKFSTLIKHRERNMSLSLLVREAVVCFCLLLATPAVVLSQNSFVPKD